MRIPLLAALLAAAAAPAGAQNQPDARAFVHPGMLQTRDGLDFMKRKVDAGEQPWKQAWENLLHEPYSQADFDPKPVAHIVRGAYGRASTGDRDLSASANAAYSQALQWYITRDRAHAKKAIEILAAWSGTLWDFEGNDAKLLAAWTGGPFCNAAEILRSTDSGWTPQQIGQFKHMLLDVYYPLLENFFPEANGNWDAAIINALLSIGIFCDHRAIFDRAVAHYLRGDGNGGITKYVYPSGQCEENARDQGHTQLGLGYFALAAQTAWSQGVDLYGTADNRLALGYEFTARYMLGEDVPMYGTISPRGRGRFSDIYESVYQHYHFGKGLEMPATARALEQARPRGWTALTFYRGSIGATPAAAPLPAGAQAEGAGALANPTAERPAGSLVVAPGESIQAALDHAAAAGGGWVILAKGLHTITGALKMASGITLAGEGRDSILWLDPQKSGPMIVNASDDLHDVTFRDFVVEAAVQDHPTTDPNQDRRVRSYQNAPSRAGILLAGQHPGQMRNIRFEHLTVRHATHNGVAVRGAAGVHVVACDFSDNGASVVPGPGLEHNLLLAHVVGGEVTGSRLDDSPWGSGLDVSESSEITVANNEAARNHAAGIHAAESNAIHIRDNLVEGTGQDGILLDGMIAGVRQAEVEGNSVHNNGGRGIDLHHAPEAVSRGNQTADNGN